MMLLSLLLSEDAEDAEAAHGEALGEEEEHSEEHGGHEVNDFGIGTLVLAMTFGMVSRMYITHMTG